MPKSTAATNHLNKTSVRDVLVQVQSRGLPELTERARERLTAMEQRDKERMQLARFDGKAWILFGKVYGD